jgi:hypothetical protein
VRGGGVLRAAQAQHRSATRPAALPRGPRPALACLVVRGGALRFAAAGAMFPAGCGCAYDVLGRACVNPVDLLSVIHRDGEHCEQALCGGRMPHAA